MISRSRRKSSTVELVPFTIGSSISADRMSIIPHRELGKSDRYVFSNSCSLLSVPISLVQRWSFRIFDTEVSIEDMLLATDRSISHSASTNVARARLLFCGISSLLEMVFAVEFVV